MAKTPKLPGKGKGAVLILIGGPGLPKAPKGGRAPKAPKLAKKG